MTIVETTILPPCADSPEAYLDERLQTTSISTLNTAEREKLRAARAAVHRQCAGCPLLVECLYRAVVEVDVSGYAACTTEAERALIRERLGIEVVQSTLTPYGAPRVGGGPVSHEAVLTARQAYPKDTCQQLAERLGCSTSTVKRHLRRDREQRAAEAARPDPTAQQSLPTIDEVLDAFDSLESSQVA
ncbi:WhiB family transcriptional regulator [Aeromicrobium sp.]|uniref:WhiB family transcriptional regulator n=1 Tax=Aeromicrobium sp. TaxID=1871063 RepID=UPI003D6A9D08